MGWTGSKHKLCRRVGEPVCGSPKCPALRRPYPPGQHGPTQARRRSRLSPYAQQLLEKQKLRVGYGVPDKQLRRYYLEARKSAGNTGERLLQLLETRLDNVVYRLGFAPTRPAARQLVRHGHVELNGRRVDIPSHAVAPGDQVRVRGEAQGMPLVRESIAGAAPVVPYLELRKEEVTGKLTHLPSRDEIPTRVDDKRVVEFYAR